MDYLVEPMDFFGLLGIELFACVGLTCCNVSCDGLGCSTYKDLKKGEPPLE
ncbi:MAG: hypothetical protein KAW12_08860 [Candidatus Aminicenantes bacterium]|nr:hypothetical protein [Candidatus Aminicenantes bacterium]